jgi:hypothetical protein
MADDAAAVVRALDLSQVDVLGFSFDISGDFVEVMWFQGLTEYLQPTK